jgi:hypothetical protein
MDEHPTWSGPERRREPRTPTNASARHALTHHQERGWGPCRVEDFSRTGAGFVLLGPPWPRYESELELLVRLDADPASGGLSIAPLHFRVRNSGLDAQGRLRVGAECLPDAGERATLAAWARFLGSGP